MHDDGCCYCDDGNDGDDDNYSYWGDDCNGCYSGSGCNSRRKVGDYGAEQPVAGAGGGAG